jgi:hypothetical protein
MNEPESGGPPRKKGGSLLRRAFAGLASLVTVGGTALLMKKRRGTPPKSEESGRGSHGTPPDPDSSHSGHELEDMSGGTMMWVMAGLGSLVAASLCLMILLSDYFNHERRESAPPLTAQQTAPLRPPEPNLQTDPVGDLARLKSGEDRLLDRYAWIDASHTRARIPLDRAITLTAGRKLDVAP